MWLFSLCNFGTKYIMISYSKGIFQDHATFLIIEIMYSLVKLCIYLYFSFVV